MRGEIGARLAFGARPRHVHSALASRHLRGFVLGAALSLVTASLLTGMAAASDVLALTVRATDVAVALGVLGLLAWLICVLVARSMLRESPAEVLRRAGRNLTRESFLATIDGLQKIDLGGFTLEFGPRQRVGSRFVELTLLTEDGRVRR